MQHPVCIGTACCQVTRYQHFKLSEGNQLLGSRTGGHKKYHTTNIKSTVEVSVAEFTGVKRTDVQQESVPLFDPCSYSIKMIPLFGVENISQNALPWPDPWLVHSQSVNNTCPSHGEHRRHRSLYATYRQFDVTARGPRCHRRRPSWAVTPCGHLPDLNKWWGKVSAVKEGFTVPRVWDGREAMLCVVDYLVAWQQRSTTTTKKKQKLLAEKSFCTFPLHPPTRIHQRLSKAQ